MTNLTNGTQELRLQSPVSDTFEWLVGGYYTHEKGGIFQRIDVFEPGTLTVDPMMPQFADIFTTSTSEEYAAFENAIVSIGGNALAGVVNYLFAVFLAEGTALARRDEGEDPLRGAADIHAERRADERPTDEGRTRH